MFAYCVNNPANRADPSGMDSFLTEDADGNGVADYLDKRWRELSVAIKAKELREQGFAVEVIHDEELAKSIMDAPPTSDSGLIHVDILDNRNDDTPNIRVIHSYQIDNSDIEGIIRYVILYDSAYPSGNSVMWGRTFDSLKTEWRAHNDIYSVYNNDRCAHVDFDHLDENTSYYGYWWRAVVSVRDILRGK